MINSTHCTYVYISERIQACCTANVLPSKHIPYIHTNMTLLNSSIRVLDTHSRYTVQTLVVHSQIIQQLTKTPQQAFIRSMGLSNLYIKRRYT